MTGTQFATAVVDYERSLGGEGHAVSVIEANPAQSKHLETARMKLFDLSVDFNQFRKDIYGESRFPVISPATLEEDAFRRDLTFNALYYNILTEKIEDPTRRGLSDLQLGLVRTPLDPHQTFSDDPLRLLRAIRFAVLKPYFTTDESLYRALSDPNLHAFIYRKISRERVGAEVEKMFTSSAPARCLEIIWDTGLFWPIFWVGRFDFEVERFTTRSRSLLAAFQKELASNPSPFAELDQLTVWTAIAISGVFPEDKPGAKVENVLTRSLGWGRHRKEMLVLFCQAANSFRTMAQTGLAASDYPRSAIAKILVRARENWPLALFVGAQQAGNPGFFNEVIQHTQTLGLEKVQSTKSQIWLDPMPVNGNLIMELYGHAGGPWVAWALQHYKQWYYDNPDRPWTEWPRPDLSLYRPGDPKEVEQIGAPCVFALSAAGCSRLHCQFNHEPEALEQLRQRLKKQPCKAFRSAFGCRRGDSCLYSHEAIADKVPQL